MAPVTERLSQTQTILEFPKLILYLILIFLIIYFPFLNFWVQSNYITHTIFELLEISLWLFTFLNTWHTYEESNLFNNRLGFALLVFVLLDLLHVMSFADFITTPNYIAGFLMDLSIKYGEIIAYFEVIAWLLLSFNVGRNKINKWVGLLMAFLASAFLLFVMIGIAHSIPLFFENSCITMSYMHSDILLTLISVYVIYRYGRKFGKSTDDRECIVYEYIAISMCVFILARLCFAFSPTVTSPSYFCGHIFKLLYCIVIYNGIYKTTVEYPYKQVKDMRDYYKNMLNIFPTGVILFDTNGKLSYTNKSGKVLMGERLSPLYGINIDEFMDEIQFDEPDKDKILKRLQNSRGQQINFQGTYMGNTNEAVRLKFTAMNSDMGIIIAVKDAKQAQAVENMQLQTQILLDSMEDAVFIIDRNKKIVMFNKTFLSTLDTNYFNVMGMRLSELSSLINADIILDRNIDCENEKLMTERAITIKTKRDRTIKLNVDTSPIYDVDNEKIGWVVVCRDITEEEKEKERAIQREKMAVIGKMAASLVHEIKNPLASIKGLCQLMSLKPSVDKITDYAAVMENAVDDISKIVSDFLQISRPAEGPMENSEINELVKSLEIMVSTNGYKNGIMTYFNYCDAEQPVNINRRQIKSVILGLVDNAIDAMTGAIDPKLYITTRYDEDRKEMQISIKDNGIGMTEEQLANVGTPFYTTKPKGTGLGISICKNIISDHGGNLKIESSFGEGSNFIIVLPCTTS